LDCLLKHILEGNVEGGFEMTGGKGRRRKQLLVGIKKTVTYSKLENEALHSTVSRIGFGRSCRLVVRQITGLLT
jgi:hypothetical protein